LKVIVLFYIVVLSDGLITHPTGATLSFPES
jgi:hypothetical protein